MTSEKIMGIRVDRKNYNEILADLPEHFEKKQKMTVLSVNPQIVVESKKYPEIVDFINKSTHCIPDGIGVVIVSKLTGGQIKERITGFDLMVRFLEYANQHQKKVFFYGAQADVLAKMCSKLATDYPQMQISGAIDGYTQLSNEVIIEQMNQVQPDFVFVALGFPKQELWLRENIEKISATVFQDVGGSFDVLSGVVKRAPQWVIQCHLEWLYRSILNPKKLGRIFQLPIFLAKSLWWRVKNRD